jgi:hypothetical protein
LGQIDGWKLMVLIWTLGTAETSPQLWRDVDSIQKNQIRSRDSTPRAGALVTARLP